MYAASAASCGELQQCFPMFGLGDDDSSANSLIKSLRGLQHLRRRRREKKEVLNRPTVRERSLAAADPVAHFSFHLQKDGETNVHSEVVAVEEEAARRALSRRRQ